MKNLLSASFILLMALFSCSKESAAPNESGTTGVSGSITRFAIAGNYLYGLNSNEVQTYDLSDPDHPKLVHRLATDYGLETITIYDGSVYLGSTTSLYILDIGNPAAPTVRSQTPRINGFAGCDPVAVKGDYAYSTIKIIQNICGNVSDESALIVFDVSDKSNPKQINQISLNIPNGLGIKDNYLFVCDEGADQMLIFDISDPLNVQFTNYSFAINDPVDLIINENRLIVSTKNSFDIYDASNITAIRRIGNILK